MIETTFLTPAFFALVIVAFAWPGFAAGLMVGAWHMMPKLSPDTAGYLPTFVILAICWFGALLRSRSQASGRRLVATYMPFLAFVGVVLAREELGGEIRASWMAIGAAVAVGFLLVLIAATPSTRISMIWGFTTPALAFSVAEVVRVASGGTLHAARAAFDTNPIFSAQYVGIAVFGVLAMVNMRRINQALGYTLIGVLLVGLGISLSRGPILAAAVAFVTWMVLSRPSKTRAESLRKSALVLGSVSLGIIAFVLLQGGRSSDGDSANVEIRLDHWLDSWSAIFADPFAGTGTNALFVGTSLEEVSPRIYPHNIFLEAWGTYGLFAILALTIALLWVIGRVGGRGKALVLFAIVCFSLSGTLTASINFWVCLGLAIVIDALPPTGDNTAHDARKLRLRPTLSTARSFGQAGLR